MKLGMLKELLAAKSAKRPTVLITELESGEQSLWIDGEATGGTKIASALEDGIERSLRRDKGESIDNDGHRYFIQPFTPPKRMIVVGAVHIAQSLVPMARLVGYDVIVVDPREAFASEPRFPGVTLVHDWPDEALRSLDPDRRTAVITLTHDPKLDDPALTVALRSDAFYIGALGGSRTKARRSDRLRDAGFNEAEIGRIHAPVGLDIGAVSPSEIAISILAEVTEVLHAPARREAA